jgi:L-fuconate dehydratase
MATYKEGMNAMSSTVIRSITTKDVRFPLEPGDGSDAIHTDPQFCYAVTSMRSENGLTGVGLAFTVGPGNDLVCRAIELLAEPLKDREITAVMSDFGSTFRTLADHQHLRWLGPHKGVIHLALASITNACFDLWAKSRGVPLWKLLLDLRPAEVLNLRKTR